MKKLLVLGSMFSALVFTGAGCAGNAPVVPAQTNTPAETPAVVPPAKELPAFQSSANKPETKQVNVANFSFAPASITVKAGTVVKWTNDDQAVHSIKSENGGFVNSTNLNTADSYEFKFDKPGVYNYTCGIHPSMQGQVIVE